MGPSSYIVLRSSLGWHSPLSPLWLGWLICMGSGKRSLSLVSLDVYPTRITLLTIVSQAPVFPSLISYLIGLVFYTTHFPECLFAARARVSDDHTVWSWIDTLGGGSHTIWHGFIVLAISQHRAALPALEEGIGGVLKAGGCLISS